jgi:hypothetical protein
VGIQGIALTGCEKHGIRIVVNAASDFTLLRWDSRSRCRVVFMAFSIFVPRPLTSAVRGGSSCNGEDLAPLKD